MAVMNRLSEMPRDPIVSFALSCQNEDGGFGGNIALDSHLLYTLSAVQVLCLFQAEDQIVDKEGLFNWVAALQREDGSFQGDKWGEIDTRFTYCAMNCLALLGQLHRINIPAAVNYIMSCQNWDAGFGVSPGAESHAGQIFCCVGALRIANAMDRIDQDRLGFWLAQRQLPSGGLNGRPEKKADVCYSWWVLSAMSVMGRVSWIDSAALIRYILSCQDVDDGGIADKPGNWPDVYHTFFGVAGLSLLGYLDVPLNKINPVFAMPPEVIRRLKIPEANGGEP